MSPGYGERIYVRRPRKKRLPAVFLALLAAALIVWLIRKPDPAPPPAPHENQPAAEASPATKTAVPGEEVSTDGVPLEPVAPVTEESPPQGRQTTPSLHGAEAAAFEETAALNRCRTLLEQRRFQEVIEALTPYTPTSPPAMALAAEAHFALQHHSESRTLMERYLQSSPNDLSAIKRLVVTCYAQNDLDAALDYCETGLELNEKDPELLAFRRKLLGELETASDFTSRESRHFSVSFDRGRHDDARYIVLSTLESAYREIGRETGIYPERIIPVILYTQQGFFDVTRAPGWAGGLYDGKIRLPVAGLTDDEELTRILRHEYTHALVNQLTPHCPLWLNEGLAEYFSQEKVPEVGQLIPLDRLERSFPAAPVRMVAAAYAESHAAVDYLIGRYSLEDLMDLLKKLGSAEAFAEAFEEVFYISYADFLKNWGKDD